MANSTTTEAARLYVAIFNRAPLQAGLDYWTGTDGLGGSITRDVMILAVINGATGTDAEKMANSGTVIWWSQTEAPDGSWSDEVKTA